MDRKGGGVMIRDCIHKYLEEHKSNYQGKYRCHSCVQTKKFERKFHYYIRDIQFREISVFLTLDYYGPEIKSTFSVLPVMAAKRLPPICSKIVFAIISVVF